MTRVGSWGRKLWEDFYSVFSPERKSVRVVHDNESPFGEFLTAERTPIIQLNSSYGTSALRDITGTEGNGTVTNVDGEIVLQTNSAANSSAFVDSGEIGVYIPGYAAQIGVGIRIENLPTGTQFVQWGGHGASKQNSLYWGYDSQGLYVKVDRDGTEILKTYQNDFNIDKVDGKGVSGYNIDISEGTIFQIDFTWYGYGQILFSIVAVLDGQQVVVPCHQYKLFSQTSITSPNLKVHTEVDNGDTSTGNVVVYLGGRQYSIFGRYIPKYRLTSEVNSSVSVSTTRTPLISFSRKDTFDDRSLKLEGATILTSSEDINWQIVLDGVLTNASFGNPSNHLSSETALESDTSATSITGGHVLYGDVASSGSGNKTLLSRSIFDVDIPNGSTVTLCAYTDSGTAGVKSALRVREEW